MDIESRRKELEFFKAHCKKRGVKDVFLDFENDFYGFVATEIVVTIIGSTGKDYLLDIFSDAVRIPDKVRRKPPDKIAAYIISRWFQARDKIGKEIIYFMNEVYDDCPENALKITESHAVPPHALWALAKYLKRDKFAASLPGQPFFTDKEIEYHKVIYETAAYSYALRRIEGDHIESAVRREIEEKTLSYRQEIERLRGKLARAPETVAEKITQIENYREMYETTRAEFEEMQRHFAEASQRYEAEISRLKKEVSLLQNLLSRYVRQYLTDLTVCVIGDETHREGYAEIIAERGGHMNFICGIEDASIVKQAVRSADAVIVVGAYCKHKVYTPAKEEAQRVNVPMVVCPSAGLGAFRETVKKLKEKLEKAS